MIAESQAIGCARHTLCKVPIIGTPGGTGTPAAEPQPLREFAVYIDFSRNTNRARSDCCLAALVACMKEKKPEATPDESTCTHALQNAKAEAKAAKAKAAVAAKAVSKAQKDMEKGMLHNIKAERVKSKAKGGGGKGKIAPKGAAKAKAKKIVAVKTDKAKETETHFIAYGDHEPLTSFGGYTYTFARLAIFSTLGRRYTNKKKGGGEGFMVSPRPPNERDLNKTLKQLNNCFLFVVFVFYFFGFPKNLFHFYLFKKMKLKKLKHRRSKHDNSKQPPFRTHEIKQSMKNENKNNKQVA